MARCINHHIESIYPVYLTTRNLRRPLSTVGSSVGICVGRSVGSSVGKCVGRSVGSSVGSMMGTTGAADTGSSVG